MLDPTIRPDSPLMLILLLTPFMNFMTVMNRMTVVHDSRELHAFHDKLGMHATRRTRITQVIRPPLAINVGSVTSTTSFRNATAAISVLSGENGTRYHPDCADNRCEHEGRGREVDDRRSLGCLAL